MQPIAVVGIGCRFPQANSPEAYWQLIKAGRQAITDVPRDRWQAEAFYDPDHRRQGKMNSCKGGFLEEIDRFDADFFGISAEEACHIDPQQRLFLEVAWESLEQAGISADSLSGSATGVFVGQCTIDYHRLLYRNFDDIGPHSGTGTTMSITANRLSYLLNLRGPSMAVDAACSSSAIAIHLACQSLQSQESTLCIVGGVNLILSPDSMISSAKTGLLSVQGACRPFDAAADGYVRGEGCGVVVLKRLSDAIAEKDNVLAVIRGSATNQDGLSNSLSAPNGPAQQALIERALAASGVAAHEIDYVEAHAVGTPLGDAIEFKSLEKVFAGKRERPCYLGSVKPNIGHLEAASGMAAIIKLILALQNDEIPPQINFEQANALINLEKSVFEVVSSAERWSYKQKKRRASMSTFGFGGTNAHIVIEEAPAFEFKDVSSSTPASALEVKSTQKTAKLETSFQDRSHHILALTAKNKAALRTLASRYQHLLTEKTFKEQFNSSGTSVDSHRSREVLLANVCFTANAGRSHFNHRLCLVSHSVSDMQRQLAQFSEGEETLLANQFIAGQVKRRKRPKVVFHFPEITIGTLQLGKLLYQTQPFFRSFFDSCVQHSNRNLTSVLLSSSSSTHATTLVTSAAERTTGFVVTYALANLWQHWGISPVGMSAEGTGRYVAACMTGSVDVQSAISALSSDAAEASTNRFPPALPSENSSNEALVQAKPAGDETILLMGANRRVASSADNELCLDELYLDATVNLWSQLLSHVGHLFVQGAGVDWKAFDQGYQELGYLRRKLSLPTYPFERSRYWFTQLDTQGTSNSNQQPANDGKVINNSGETERSKNNRNSGDKKVISFPKCAHPYRYPRPASSDK